MLITKKYKACMHNVFEIFFLKMRKRAIGINTGKNCTVGLTRIASPKNTADQMIDRVLGCLMYLNKNKSEMNKKNVKGVSDMVSTERRIAYGSSAKRIPTKKASLSDTI